MVYGLEIILKDHVENWYSFLKCFYNKHTFEYETKWPYSHGSATLFPRPIGCLGRFVFNDMTKTRLYNFDPL